MYKYHVLRSSPIAFWQLDDPTPFDERSGYGYNATANSAPGRSVPLVNGANWSSVFSASAVGSFDVPVFKKGTERKPFVLESWVLPIQPTLDDTAPQQILSHSGKMDGLSINGKSVTFSVEFATQPAVSATYDLGENQLAHVVGVFTETDIELWVNSRVVASMPLTEQQKFDSYPDSDGKLYCGATTSSQKIAVNGVAVYNILPSADIERNYRAGIETIGQARIPVQRSGIPIELSSESGSVFYEETWTTDTDFKRGLAEGVEYAADYIAPSTVDGVPTAGRWSVGIPLDSADQTVIYGVALSWSGLGAAVECSLDGETWTPAKSGELVSIIEPNSDQTGKDLEIRVLIEAGGRLDSLYAVGYSNNKVNNVTLNPITLTHPALVRKDSEANLFRDDNGVFLGGGSITIGPDASETPEPVRTIELWLKPRKSGVTIGGPSGMTLYRNGVVSSTWPVGEWSLIHVVSNADITSDISIVGDAIIGQMALYDETLTQEDVTHIWNSYNGTTAFRVEDSDVITISEPAPPVSTYAHDWSISQAG